ncbi:MAG: fimbrillin family protein [Candidatus Cryptobacteroides sp.]
MNKKLIIALLAGLSALTSCNKVEDVPVEMQVRLTPIITKALSLNFRENDRIGVNIKMEEGGSIYASNEMMTYDGNCFAGDLKWYKDGASKCTVTAWYPYNEAGFPSTFSVALDQSKGTEASDFMLAVEKGVYPSSNAVLAKFHHQLSQINVVIKANFDVEIESVQIKNVIPTASLSFNEDGSLAVAVMKDASPVDITAEEITAGKLYSAVLVPQDLSSFGLCVKVKNGSTILSGISNASLKQGYAYTITATVTAEQVTAGISGEIVDWTDGGSLDSGDYKVPFEEHDGYFIYDGVRYNTVEIDGRTWMASNLAFLPMGQSPSADPSSGSIFYPYTSDGTTATALTDNASIKAKGYLYRIETALGGVSLNDDNFSSFEGARGICPEGWHIPSREEHYSLCGYSNKNEIIGETTAQTDEQAFLWDASVKYSTLAKFDEAGFNFTFGGMIANNKYQTLVLSSKNCSVEEYYGNTATNYLMTSTAMTRNASNPSEIKYNFGVLMTTFTSSAYPLGRMSIAYLPHSNGACPLRCIKDK